MWTASATQSWTLPETVTPLRAWLDASSKSLAR